MDLQARYHQVMQNIHEKVLACGRQLQEVTLIAVSKIYPVESIQSIYQAGERNFGESRIQEALEKIPYLPADCQWHLIGTLQSNKVTKAISNFSLIHSVDTLELAQKISQASQAKDVITSILLQVNTSGEKSKHGLDPEGWQQVLEAVNQLSHLKIEGLMTMAPYTGDQEVVRACFRTLYQLRESWGREIKDPNVFHHLSMGMSNDYLMAIEEGATLLRVGSAIFGNC